MNSNKNNRSTTSSKNSIKADAEFLEYAAKEQLEIITPSTSSTAYASLHRSNIIKLQTDQLLEESYITTTTKKKDKKKGGDIANSSDTLLGSAPWYNTIAEPYIDTVQYILDNHLPEVTLNTPSSNKNNKNENGYPFQIFADRNVSVTIGGGDSNDNKLRMYTGYRRTESSVLNQLGYTNPQSGNANVIPTIERTILIPSSTFTSSNDSSNKDYLRHRYTDVSRMLMAPEF
jgi:hypothetical protein